MKYLRILIAVFSVAFLSPAAHAIDSKGATKIRQECKKRAKKLKKEGWTVFGKAIDMEEALITYYTEAEKGRDSLQTLIATGQVSDINQARRMAETNASNQLAGMREINIKSESNVHIKNEQRQDTVKSCITTDATTHIWSSQVVKKLVPKLTLRRQTDKGKVEVMLYYLVKP